MKIIGETIIIGMMTRVSGIAVEVKNGQFERALRKFKKKVTDAGIIQELETESTLSNQVKSNVKPKMLARNVGKENKE